MPDDMHKLHILKQPLITEQFRHFDGFEHEMRRLTQRSVVITRLNHFKVGSQILVQRQTGALS